MHELIKSSSYYSRAEYFSTIVNTIEKAGISIACVNIEATKNKFSVILVCSKYRKIVIDYGIGEYTIFTDYEFEYENREHCRVEKIGFTELTNLTNYLNEENKNEV